MKKTFSEQYPELAKASEENKKKKGIDNKNNKTINNTNSIIDTYKLYGSVTEMTEFEI